MASRILKLLVAASCFSFVDAQQANSRVKMIESITEYHSVVKKGSAFMLFMMPGAKHDMLIPIFEKLAAFYHDDKATTIAAFDCSFFHREVGHHIEICKKNLVDPEHYPALLFFHPEVFASLGKGDHYMGKRTFEAISDFIEEHLVEQCDYDTMKKCSDEEKSYIEDWDKKTKKEVIAEVNRLHGLSTKHSDERKAFKPEEEWWKDGSARAIPAGDLGKEGAVAKRWFKSRVVILQHIRAHKGHLNPTITDPHQDDTDHKRHHIGGGEL